MRVRIRAIDDDHESHFFDYRARNLEIAATSKSFTTPQRILNNSDLNAKANTPTETTLNSPFAGFHFEINQKDTENLLTTNTYPQNLFKRIITLKRQLQHSSLLFPFIQPAKSAVDNCLYDEKRKNQALRRILAIQRQSCLPIISVPWLGYSTEKYLNLIDYLTEETEQEYLFFIRATDSPNLINEVSLKIKEKIENGRLNFVGIISSPIQHAISSYDILWEHFCESDAGLILVGIDRYDSNYFNLSSSHLSQCYLGDLFLPRVRRGFDNSKKSEPIQVRDKLRVFYNTDLTVNPIREFKTNSWIDEVHNLLPDNSIRIKLDNYTEAETDSKKYNVLNYITKVHEFISSSKEFSLLQKYIDTQEMDSYIEEKSSLMRTLEKNK